MKFVKLIDIVLNKKNSIVDGPFGSSLKNSDYVDKGIPVLQGKNITGDKFNFADVRFIKEEKADTLSRSKVQVGDYLLVKIGSIGYLARIDTLNGFDYAIIPANLAKINIDEEKIYPPYFEQIFKQPITKWRLSNLASKTAQPALSLSKIKSFEIPIPNSYSDQTKIATVLSKAETLINQRKKSVSLLNVFLKNTFLNMFGDPVRNEMGWPGSTLRDVCNKIQDGTHFSPTIIEEGIPYVTAKHIRENVIDFWANPWFISEESHREIYKRCDPKRGDVIYIKDGATTGHAAINNYDFEFSMLSSIAMLRVNNQIINSEYLCYWLNNQHVKKGILNQMTGGAIKRLTLTKINKLDILVPPLALQNQFATIVKKAEALKAQFQNSITDLENLYASLCQRAFKGELDLRNTTTMGEEKFIVSANDGAEEWQFNQPNTSNTYKEEGGLQEKNKRDKKIIGTLGLTTAEQLEWSRTSFTNIAEMVRRRFWNTDLNRSFYFNAEMLYNHLQGTFGDTITYFTTKELLMKPSLQERETFKSFVESALKDERFPIHFEQVFYNAEEENFNLEIAEADFGLLEKESKQMRSGVYFKIK